MVLSLCIAAFFMQCTKRIIRMTNLIVSLHAQWRKPWVNTTLTVMARSMMHSCEWLKIFRCRLFFLMGRVILALWTAIRQPRIVILKFGWKKRRKLYCRILIKTQLTFNSTMTAKTLSRPCFQHVTQICLSTAQAVLPLGWQQIFRLTTWAKSLMLHLL